jgi:CheY-like chemotaxis protein
MEDLEETVLILMADDDEDDRMLTQKALLHNRPSDGIRFVSDGEELLDYLLRRGQFSDPALAPLPGLILLDLNMPKKNGLEALAEIKSHPELHTIPVIVLTSSKAEEDILRSYDLGVNSYITKPDSFQALTEMMKVLCTYWFELVERPG